jgi:hypothetical protein
VTFSVTVKNTSAVDSVTTSLVDNVYGNLDGREPVTYRRAGTGGEL